MRWSAAFRALVGAYLREEKGRTLLTLLGVALGVAVLVAIDLANESAVASFKDSVRSIAGRATLVVRANGGGLPGDTVARAAAVPGIESVAPLIQGTVRFRASGSAAPQQVLFLGVDMLASEERGEAPVRDLQFEIQPGRDFTTFLTDPRALVVTETFAARHGIAPGDGFTLEVNGAPRAFVAAALIAGDAWSDTYSGNVVVADAGMADLVLARGGRLDRIDIVTAEGADLAAVEASLREALPNAIIERPEARGERVEQMLAAFRFNLDALGHISVVVGAFLIFNTMSVAVTRRRPAIGTLRALGLPAGVVRRVFLAEGALFGAVGGVAGVALGIAMAHLLAPAVATAISINFVQTPPAGLHIDPAAIAKAYGLGLAFSLVAALRPANEAAATPPANTMRAGAIERTGVRWPALLAGGAMAAALAAVLATRTPRPGLPVLGYASSVLLIVAFTLWARPMLALAAAAGRGVYARLFGAEGLLAAVGVQGSLSRSSIAVCGLMMGLAMTVSVGVMVASFRGTVTDWMEQVLKADLFIAAREPDAGAPRGALDDAFLEELRAIPGVRAVGAFRGHRVMVNGREAWLGGGDFDTVQFSNSTLDGRNAREAMQAAKAAGALVLSESFARKHGLARGDTLELATPAGTRRFAIEAVYYDYSSEQGYALMDRGLFAEIYGDTTADSASAYLAEGADAAAVRLAAEALADARGLALELRSNTELRAAALRAFDATFAVTTALEAIAIAVSVLGVATTLVAQVIDRRFEIATLRHIGVTRRRVGRMVVLESGLLAAAGIVLGIAAGLALSWVLTRVIMLESFGWTIRWEVQWAVVARGAAIVLAATLLAGLIPAREAVRQAPARLGEAT